VTEFPDTPREHDDEDAEEMHGSGNGAALSQPQEENGDANRRRRRRGRRGGRRNRRGREGEPQTASESGGHEAEPVHIGADFETASPAEDDRQPRQVPIMESHVDAPAPAVEPRELPPAEAMPEHEPASQAVSTPAAANDAEPPAPEPPRRRSTVREPAPAASHGVSESPPALVNSPSAEPVIISPADSESSDRPRRSGWWSRRALGKG
jgi:ribonuclease E